MAEEPASEPEGTQEPQPGDAEPSEEEHPLICGCTARQAPGWAALEGYLTTRFDTAPTYFSSDVADDDSPVEGVACFRLEAPEPHWVLVSCGLTELYDKQFISPEVSGYGFELSMRVPLGPDPETPPMWPIGLMRNLARYVAATRRAFSEGEYMNAHAPLALDEPCTLSAVCFLEDAALPPTQTPNGAVVFFQVLGLTDDELDAVMDGDALDFIALVAQRNPSFICGANRPSYLDDEELALQVTDRIASGGSTTPGSGASDLRIREVDGVLEVHLGAIHARALVRGLRHRVPFEREYTLTGASSRLLLAPAPTCAWHADTSEATLMLSAEGARALADSLGETAGRYAAPSVPRVVIELHATELTDDEGNVVRVIG